jgi:hypothetical protein
MKRNAIKQPTKLITSLNSKCYWPSGTLIQKQICICLAAGGVPVAEKHRAANQTTKVRTSLYSGNILEANIFQNDHQNTTFTL